MDTASFMILRFCFCFLLHIGSELLGRHAVTVFECCQKMGKIIKSALMADIGDGRIGGPKQLFRKGIPRVGEVLLKRHTGKLLELRGKIIRGIVGNSGDLI